MYLTEIMLREASLNIGLQQVQILKVQYYGLATGGRGALIFSDVEPATHAKHWKENS